MKIVKTYSFKGGEEFIRSRHPEELADIQRAIGKLDAVSCLTKKSMEKTKKGELLFSPLDMNHALKTTLHKDGWTKRAEGRRKKYAEPRHAFGGAAFREMDGLKNKVGLEIQFGKYAFMGYDIFSKMVIFKNLGYIECGMEVVPARELSKQMSSGVSSFEQLLVDFEHRGESDIDIPVLVIAIGLTEREKQRAETRRKDATVKLRTYRGSRPGPK